MDATSLAAVEVEVEAEAEAQGVESVDWEGEAAAHPSVS